MNSHISSNKFKRYAYYPVILFLPIYVLFSFFPNLVNIPIYEVPPANFFPSFNNYWSLANTGIESFLLTFLAFLYVWLNLYLAGKRDILSIEANSAIKNYTLLSFI